MVMVSEDEKFNPASATREIFTQAINRALNDMTDAQIESLVQSAVGTEMSQRQMADLNLQSALESSVSAIRSELTLKASTSDVTAAVADEAAARQAADTTVYNSAAELVTDETAARQSADTELHDAVGAVAALGAKNLFPSTAISQTIGGVTFTVNSDGTITANGTKTNSDWFILSENNHLDAGAYTLSDGLPDDTTGCRLIIAPEQSLGAAIMTTTTGVRTQTKTFTAAQTGLYYAIRIASGETVNNLTFKPMIRRAEITDSTYVPYAPTNRELYEMILALQSGRSVQSSAASLMQAGRLDAELTDTQEVTDDA